MNMKQNWKRGLRAAVCMLVAFTVWTILVCLVDVRPIGPCASSVGFATLNGLVHDLTGTSMLLYRLTDWLGLVPFAVAACFGVLGLLQWIKRKSLFRVDRELIVLGVLYLAVITVYLFFEYVVINYRPILIDGVLEASYPSSTTMLVGCVMPTAAIWLDVHIRRPAVKRWILSTVVVFTVFMTVARILSGVHWITDVIGGAMLSSALVSAYAAFTYGRAAAVDCRKDANQEKNR